MRGRITSRKVIVLINWRYLFNGRRLSSTVLHLDTHTRIAKSRDSIEHSDQIRYYSESLYREVSAKTRSRSLCLRAQIQ